MPAIAPSSNVSWAKDDVLNSLAQERLPVAETETGSLSKRCNRIARSCGARSQRHSRPVGSGRARFGSRAHRADGRPRPPR